MKYIVIIGDGMGDYPLSELSGKTPLMAADKPAMNELAGKSELGLARTLYNDLPTGSDIANLSVLGYNPRKYYTGRSPIEALGIGIELSDTDTVFRCNFVTLTQDGAFEEKTILDHSSGKISNDEAFALLDAIKSEFENGDIVFYRGVSYRHIMVWKNINYDYIMTPPHDILGQKIKDYLPCGSYSTQVLGMMRRSYEILMSHPVNIARLERGQSPANCIWLWGEGKKPTFESFFKKYAVRGSVITAVPLVEGLAAGMGLGSIKVEGATGDYYTNYKGKAKAALDALAAGDDFVFVHIEAPDECGHDGDIELKVKSIEQIDKNVVSVIKEEMDKRKEPYKMLILPDHYTPIIRRTHTTEPVPYLLFDSRNAKNGVPRYDEEAAAASGIVMEDGFELMGKFLRQ
jgi:2,3-bisphosphoglycerate-independent phosphoglycerate mutase